MSRAARLGAFILATLAILAAGVFLIGSKQYLFTSTYQLKAQFATVVGLNPGADVLVGGVHAGAVRAIELPHKPTGKITTRNHQERFRSCHRDGRPAGESICFDLFWIGGSGECEG
jgi:ABC-type transporter Mla subunit MlaD